MEESTGKTGWIVGCAITSLLFVITLVWGLAVSGQNAKLSSELDTANASLSKYTSSNAQNQQSCINDARNQYETPGSGLLPNTGSALSGAISACQAEYPAN